MNTNLQQLIDSLRNELQQYGEILALLEAQQGLVVRGEVQSVLTSIASVELQSAAIQAARNAREKAQRQLGWAVGLPEGGDFSQLIPLLPGEYRPLFAALVEEVNQLLERVRACAQCNHSQLQQALTRMDHFIATLSPEVLSDRPARETNSSRTDPTPLVASV